jgi:hypothetical protein
MCIDCKFLFLVSSGDFFWTYLDDKFVSWFIPFVIFELSLILLGSLGFRIASNVDARNGWISAEFTWFLSCNLIFWKVLWRESFVHLFMRFLILDLRWRFKKLKGRGIIWLIWPSILVVLISLHYYHFWPINFLMGIWWLAYIDYFHVIRRFCFLRSPVLLSLWYFLLRAVELRFQRWVDISLKHVSHVLGFAPISSLSDLEPFDKIRHRKVELDFMVWLLFCQLGKMLFSWWVFGRVLVYEFLWMQLPLLNKQICALFFFKPVRVLWVIAPVDWASSLELVPCVAGLLVGQAFQLN